MNFYIPELGDVIVLASDWSFDLYAEHRNEMMCKAYNETAYTLLKKQYRYWYNSEIFARASLPAGTSLKIDRIYIRRGLSDYSSITFKIVESSNKNFKKKRFWVKLKDANTIEFQRVEK